MEHLLDPCTLCRAGLRGVSLERSASRTLSVLVKKFGQVSRAQESEDDALYQVNCYMVTELAKPLGTGFEIRMM